MTTTDTAVLTRPLAVGYVCATDRAARARQLAALHAYAHAEGLALVEPLQDDQRDGMTVSELAHTVTDLGAARLLMPSSATMAIAARRLTELLAESGAACTVVPDQDTAQAYMVLLDIDGTTTTNASPSVPDATARAIARVRAAGHHIVFASGRSLVGILPITRAVGLERGWAIASNGAVTARLDPEAPGGYLAEAHDTVHAGPVIDLALKHHGKVTLGAEEIGQGYLVNREFTAGQVSGRQRVVSLQELRDQRTPRLILSAPGISEGLLGQVRDLGVTANPANPDWIDVTPAGLSKATAADAVRQVLGVPRRYTLAVDDGVNGIELLRWAARGVAMGHAPQRVKDAADEVTGTIDEAGLITVLESLPTLDQGDQR
jgi:HAD superfamily hydrolase (TIGR01484 family)